MLNTCENSVQFISHFYQVTKYITTLSITETAQHTNTNNKGNLGAQKKKEKQQAKYNESNL